MKDIKEKTDDEERKKEKKEAEEKERRKWKIIIFTLVFLTTAFLATFRHFFELNLDFQAPKFEALEIMPLVILFLFSISLWAYRIYLEIFSQYDKKKPLHLTVNMFSIFTAIGAMLGLILQGTVPGWWKNILNSDLGIFFLLALLPLFTAIYIFPGTEEGTVKWGKRITGLLGIFIVFGILYAAINGDSAFTVAREPASDYSPATTPEVSEPSASNSKIEEMEPPVPIARWEEVFRKYAEYNQWSEEDQGWITVLEFLEEGARYRLKVEETSFRQSFLKEGAKIWQKIPPEGIVGLYSTEYHQRLPLIGSENNWVGARIMREKGLAVHYFGSSREFLATGAGPLQVSINVPQSPGSFLSNEGGDWVVLYKWVES